MTALDGLEEHRRSIAAFVAAAEAVPEDAWEVPLEEGKWSPAQVAEHLRLSYEVIRAELRGEGGFRVRVAWWLRPILRLAYLRQILREGRFHVKARAPREARPGPGPFPRGEVLARFREGAVETEGMLAENPRARVTHHVFGRLGAGDGLRLLTAHNAHHTSQITTQSTAG